VPAFAPGALDELRTERLLLQRPREENRADLRSLQSDPEVMATLGGVRSAGESDDIFDRLVSHWSANGFGYWVLRDLEGGRFVGRGGLRLLVVDGEPEMELGYGLMSEFWNRGLATELARAAARAAIEVIGVRSLVCFTTSSNEKSKRVMEKAGFRYEKDFVYAELPHRLCRLSAGRWRDVGSGGRA
jgi:ribosomal-protein-alanine N-acetyltransferase